MLQTSSPLSSSTWSWWDESDAGLKLAKAERGRPLPFRLCRARRCEISLEICLRHASGSSFTRRMVHSPSHDSVRPLKDIGDAQGSAAFV